MESERISSKFGNTVLPNPALPRTIARRSTAMQLSVEQKNAVQMGEPVRVHDADTDLDWVVLRADVFDRIRGIYARADVDPRELYPLIDETMAEDDAHDPLLESYQKLKGHA
jgi:hypothetical protein